MARRSMGMKKGLIGAVLTLALGSLPSFGGADSPEAGLFRQALSKADLTPASASFEPSMFSLFRQGEFITSIYSACTQRPWDMPRFAQARRKDLIDNAAKPSELVNLMAGLVGTGTRRSLVGNPIAFAEEFGKKPGSLPIVLGQLKKRGLISQKAPSLAVVPAAVQQATATLLAVAQTTIEMRRLAFEKVDRADDLFKQVSQGGISEDNFSVNLHLTESYRKVQVSFLEMAGHDLTLAVQAVKESLKQVSPTTKYAWRLRTDWGIIRLSGGGDTTYENEPSLITIDTGGNDTYINGPSNTSLANWLSISIDTDGNDKYVSDRALESTPVAGWSGRKSGNRTGPGGAVMGVCILSDTKGNDLYRTHRPGLGSARLGVSVLLDEEGDDEYDAYTDSIGVGSFGVGIVEDLSGNDTYRGFNQVQGVGLTGGGGLLLDLKGNDKYIANDELLDFPSPQSTQHNVSMAQGAGNGRRGDYLEGLSYAGGIGVLIDAEGDDSYSCGVFGQGVGYWMGVGWLLDSSGADTYNGQWYVQGAAAHFAVGYLDDGAGNDKYLAPLNMAQGAGHDFSLAGLLDHAGNDSYVAPNLGLGAGNANGIGWFVDLTGDDRYQASGVSLGQASDVAAGSLRSFAFSLGLFVDGAGNDIYVGIPYASNGKESIKKADLTSEAHQTQVGIFWDR